MLKDAQLNKYVILYNISLLTKDKFIKKFQSSRYFFITYRSLHQQKFQLICKCSTWLIHLAFSKIKEL